MSTQVEDKGVVKFFDKNRGFGFVTCNGRDVFVHATACEASEVTIDQGDRVVFTTKLGKNGGVQVDRIRKEI